MGETTVCHSGLGKTFFGSVCRRRGSCPLAEMFAGCGFPCEVCSQVQGMIWDKLMINASSACCRHFAGGPGLRRAGLPTPGRWPKLIRELCAAATADGYPFDAEEQIARIRLHLQKKAPDGFTSIYADLKAGRRTEVDVINSAVVEAGHRRNIPVPPRVCGGTGPAMEGQSIKSRANKQSNANERGQTL